MNAAQREIFAPKMNWRQVLEDLDRAGCSGYRVAKTLGVNWSTVQHWRDYEYAELKYGLGRALLRLHARYCGADMTAIRQAEAEDNGGR